MKALRFGRHAAIAVIAAGALALTACGSDNATGTAPAGDQASSGPKVTGTLTGIGATGLTFGNAVLFGNDFTFGSVADNAALTFMGATDLGGSSRTVTTLVDVAFTGAVTNGSLTNG